jgi:hypothetical protein
MAILHIMGLIGTNNTVMPSNLLDHCSTFQTTKLTNLQSLLIFANKKQQMIKEEEEEKEDPDFQEPERSSSSKDDDDSLNRNGQHPYTPPPSSLQKKHGSKSSSSSHKSPKNSQYCTPSSPVLQEQDINIMPPVKGAHANPLEDAQA